jgi:hypothetical protein
METTPTDGPRTTPPARRRQYRRVVCLALVAAVALPGLACSDNGDDEGSTSAGEMTISVAEPADGAEVASPFDVQVDTSVPLGEPDTGRHHVHLYYDGNTSEGEYDLVYGPSFTVDRLDPGEHTIEAVIANADHSLTDARQEITVTVGDGDGDGSSGGSDGSGSTPSTTEMDDSGGDYGY